MRMAKRSGEHETEIKRSRFLCAIQRVDSDGQARELIQHRRKEHHDARHHCYAYVLGDDGQTQKSSDDGEPAGTAGVPMLEVLRRNELTNTVAVVSRYFGGVLLGAGGLVRAYGGAVSATLDQLGMVELRPMRTVSTRVDYTTAGKLENELRSAGHHVADVHYAEDVRFTLHVPDAGLSEFRDWLAGATAGSAAIELGETTYTEVDVP
ncbi:YigZ family protein [Parasphingorhabdus pacifica]